MPNAPVPPLAGILETALYVGDIARARVFYEDVMGLRAMVTDPRLAAYPVAAGSVLLLFQRGATLEPVRLPGGTVPPHDGTGPLHMAFAVAQQDLAAWQARLEAHDVVIESKVTWPKGGTSLYFRDPDGHALELASPGLWQNY